MFLSRTKFNPERTTAPKQIRLIIEHSAELERNSITLVLWVNIALLKASELTRVLGRAL